MNNIIAKHKEHWSKKSFLHSTLSGFLLLLASLIVNYNAVNYADSKASSPVTDLFLDILPIKNMDFIFIYGAIIFIFIVFIVVMNHPKFLPFVLKSVAVFVLIRSFSMILTHIGPIPDQPPLDLNRFFKIFTDEGDLFFSGHTGIPYLMALIFWKDKKLKLLFLTLSMIGGLSVLIGRMHYSIDVFAAFFITFGIFHISKNLFKEDYEYAIKD
ncbi:MAG: sphingomyelin synthase family protein [Patescibacteria group bacterium]|nr:sphingomyelin synthase family protein [Patescibacteria group bacterium]